MTPQRRAYMQQLGSKGGTATRDKYGPFHFKQIGAVGFAVYAELHHGGNRAAARASLVAVKPQSFSKGR